VTCLSHILSSHLTQPDILITTTTSLPPPADNRFVLFDGRYLHGVCVCCVYMLAAAMMVLSCSVGMDTVLAAARHGRWG
jgi:hypothetical protein